MAAPELRLKVTLDTSFLKGQISRLPLDFTGANVSIRPKFDRQTIVNEFRLLNRYIGGKKFNITIASNLDAEIKNADRLIKALGRVQQAASGAKGGLPIGTQVLSRTKTKGGFAAAEIKALFGAAVQGGLIDDKTLASTRAQMVTALGSIGRDSIAGLLNGLKSGDADIQNAAKFLGNNLITSFKTVLGIASPSREFKKIGESAGQGFEQGLLKSIEIAEQSATRKMQRMLDRLARMALMMSGMSGPEIGRQVAQARALPSLNFGATTPRSPVGIGPSSSGRMLPAAPSRTAIAGAPAPAGLLPSLSSAGQSKAIIEALIASTGPRLLPSGGGDDSLGKLAAPRQTKDAVDAILRNYFKVVEAQVKEVFSAPPIQKESLNIFDHLDTEQYFNYLAQARVNAENAIKRSIEEAKQVTKQNQIKDAAQSFLRALEETVRNAERSAFTQSRIAANNSYIQRANIRETGQPLLGGRQVAPPKMLSAATGFYRGAATPPPLPETQAQLFARREREARMRSVIRGVDVMGETPTRAPARYSYANRPAMPRRPTSAIVPYEAGGALVPNGGGGGGAPPVPPRGGGGGGAFGGMQFNVPKLPGAGLVREIGEEFGFAAKQVLLYGAAYKALGLLQAFPSQVGEAVGALQSFRNTLNAISPTAQEAVASSEFILNIVDKYNVPLQSARDGFTKLYASMAPTGFSGNEIRDLFTGISQAAATFGMSSDKVDRVTYAFAQMASKGQVMSEELKGQLGDVLPGAMGIFAKAAGFEGADAIQKFGKALEDGAFKGKPMRDLLKNVTVELKREFGPGAEGAARTYQGVMTRMANSTKLLYESFEPVAINFLNSIVVPITGGLKTVTDGFKAFFTGQAAQTAGGSAFAKQLEGLRPTFEGIRSNITSLIPIFQNFGKILLAAGQVFLQIASNPFVGYLARVYLNVVALTTVVNILNLRALIPFIANLARSAYSVVAFGVQCTLAGQKAVFFDLMVRTLGTTLRTFFAATAVGIILVGIGLIAEAFVTAGARADAARQKMSQFADSVKQLGAVGDVAGATAEKVGQQSLGARLQSAKALLQQVKSEGKKLTTGQVQELKNLQLTGNLDFVEVRRGPEKGMLAPQAKLTDLLGTQAALQAEIDSAGRGYLETQTKIVQATRAVTEAQSVQKKQGEESKAAGATAIDLSAGDGTKAADKAADKAARDAERLANQKQQLLMEEAALKNGIDQASFEGLMSSSGQLFDYQKQLIEERNKLELSGLNDIEARQRKFQQDLKAVELSRIEAVRRATDDLHKTELDFVSAQRTAAAAGTGAPAAPTLPPPARGPVSPRVGSSFQGFPVTSAPGESRAYRNGTHEGYDFATPIGTALSYAIGGVVKSINKVGSGNAGKTLEVVLDNGIIGMSMHLSEVLIEAGQRFTAGQLLAKTGDTGAGPAHLHQESAPHAYKSGQAGASLAYLNIGKGKAMSGPSFSMEKREDKAERSVAVEAQNLENKATQLRITLEGELQLALERRASILAANTDSIFPVAQQQLENKLMGMRNQLMLQGMPEEFIGYQEDLAKRSYESAEATKKLEEGIKNYKTEIASLQDKQKAGIALSPVEISNLKLYQKGIKQNAQELARLTEQQKAYNIAALESAIASIKNADALKAQQDAIQLIDSNVESATGSYKNFIKEVAQGGDPAEALKKFQESITDQVLTVFLDYAFQPVEEFLKDSLKNMFGLPTEEKQRQETLTKLQEQLDQQKAILVQAEKIATNTTPGAAAGAASSLQSPVAGSAFAPGGTLPAAAAGFDAASVFGSPEALTSAFGGVQASISESMNGIVSSFENGASSLGNALPAWDTALATNIPDALKTSTNETNNAVPTFQESLGKVTAGIGIAAGAIMGIAAGISQIKEGGTSNVLGGIGSVLMSLGGAVGGFAGFFKGANGGVAGGGWKPFPVTAFANGGMVNGPTLGLVGEGKYNEAIVPLPDGKSIPVQMRGGGGLREAMSGNNGKASGSPILNMSFQSTNINGVEYVSRDQLEAAMATTRKQAAKDGANRGMTMTLDKLQQSPQTRNRLGMG